MPKVAFHVPHTLPVEDAAARLLAGIPKLEKAIPGGGTVEAERIGDDGMQLCIGIMGQTIVVDSTLTADSVAGTVDVPLVLTMMKGQIAQMVETAVARMLSKP
ncbi:Putative polyhydroxyalkanoic acid system protein (PHA_gran_rgn) [Loktanella fryxellensis]|uniref:Putative polyhydroxyalkanoic acid system protein (PHA_gran_rgn) n=1 Tax=Loktanella fryxellensis TaxID=245187 RepID=A0A1H8EDR1_9RHOB|nr:polyhydroxyalkanoic acid system family protein [Loktanella fryxellensis]SEN17556.1 Putative polyhydroxyalkanoic acid system protein (PHA_gran_rgn) [Loktanella fryxellensis]